ncbi:MAG: molybdenum cofactor cytidylyltransferase [Anaerolineae bacterium]
MRLEDAFDIKQCEVAAFVGAGGKTGAMFRLADELVARGLRVITTTTTRLARAELAYAPLCITPTTEGGLPPDFATLIEQHRHILIYGAEEGDKVRGVEVDWLETHLSGHSAVDVLLVEADGSRQLPFKGAYPHEPVLPPSVTLVVPVMGLDALGQPLNEEHIYGAERITEMIGIAPGTPLTPAAAAAALLHPQLGMKDIPPRARVIPLLNKVSGPTLDPARDIAQRLLTDHRVNAVLIGAVHEEPPVRERRQRIGAVVLAAGQSSRMGEPKLLLPWREGETIIRHVCRVIASCGLYEIVVVTGQWHEAIREQVGDLPVRPVYNPRYAEGEMLSSLQTGLSAIWRTSSACLVVLGDQPGVEAGVVRDLIRKYSEGCGRIVAPSYQNRRGHPMIIERSLWEEIMQLPEGAAPRDVIRAHEREICHHIVSTQTVLRDIDTPDDYRRALEE